MSELYRIAKPEGIALVMCLVDYSLQETDEDPSITGRTNGSIPSANTTTFDSPVRTSETDFRTWGSRWLPTCMRDV